MDKRKILEAVINGDVTAFQQLKAENIPTVFISMPDGSIDVGHSKAFGSRYVEQKELNKVLEKTGGSKTIFMLPNNGHDTI